MLLITVVIGKKNEMCIISVVMGRFHVDIPRE